MKFSLSQVCSTLIKGRSWVTIKYAVSTGWLVYSKRESMEFLLMKCLWIFVITSKISRISTGHIKSIYSSESVLSFYSICSIGILDIFEVIVKIAKCSTLGKAESTLRRENLGLKFWTELKRELNRLHKTLSSLFFQDFWFKRWTIMMPFLGLFEKSGFVAPLIEIRIQAERLSTKWWVC